MHRTIQALKCLAIIIASLAGRIAGHPLVVDPQSQVWTTVSVYAVPQQTRRLKGSQSDCIAPQSSSSSHIYASIGDQAGKGICQFMKALFRRHTQQFCAVFDACETLLSIIGKPFV